MKKIVFLALAIILIASMALIGCNKASTTTTAAPPSTTTKTTTSAPPASTTAAPTPTKTTVAPPEDNRLPNLGNLAKPAGGKTGGRLQLVTAGGILNLSDISQGAGPNDAGFAFPCVEPLLRLDGNQQLQPWLAEKFEIAADFSSITLNLRKGIKFHDGTPFNAAAVKWVLDTAIANTVYTQAHAFQSPVIVDDYTVKLNFVDGKWNWDSAKGLAYWWGMLMYSPTAAQTHDSDWLKTNVVGTGPFILKEYVRDQKCSYDANVDYWRGKPYLDGIDFNIIPDPTTQLLSYKSGELHVIGVQPKDVDTLKAEGYSIIETQDAVPNNCLVPSSKDPNSPLSNIKVRQAVAYAIDQDALIQGITYNHGSPSQQLFPLPPYKNTSVTGYPYNPNMAKQLLQEAGFGTGLTIKITYSEFTVQELPVALKDMLAQVGITLELNKVSSLQTGDMIFTSGWDGYLISFTFPGKTIDPGFTAGMYITQFGWVSLDKPADIAAVINQAAVEPDNAKRTALYQQIDKMMTDQCVFQYLYWIGGFTSISPELKAYTIGQYSEFYAYTFAYLD